MTADDGTGSQNSRLSNHQILPSALLVVGFAAIVALLVSGLRPDAFFVGDPGIKLIAAKNAIAHPDHPLDIPLPVIGHESLPYIEPFFEAHNGHAHAVTTDLFPVISAPLLRWFGMRGVYLLPALGFLGILVGCAWLATALDVRRSPALVVLIAAIAAPFLFYGLEFWEHAPAIALATGATAWFITADRARTGRAAMTAGAGLAFGAAILLRPELAWALVAVLIAWLVGLRSDPGPARESRVVPIFLVLAGVAIVLAPLEIYTLRHFGRVMPAHLWANAQALQMSWTAQRAHVLTTWLLPSRWTWAGPSHPESFWTVAPLVLLAFLPVRRDAKRDGRRFLWIVFGVVMLLVLLTAPNDGGGQWTPRYLLFAYVPLVILAADTVDALPRGVATRMALAVVLLACLWTQRAAYRELRGAKATYGRIVDFVAAEVGPTDYLVTDLWWLDQVAAPVTAERRVLFVPDTASGHAVMQRLNRAVAPIVVVVRSASESPDQTAWQEDTCYVEIKRDSLAVRGLVAITLHHRCRA